MVYCAQNIVCFDAESNGLHGPAFAIGGVVLRDQSVLATFFARCPISGDVDPWVAANVLPALKAADRGVTHTDANQMRNAFWKWLTRHMKGGALCVVDCGWPVETGLLSACVDDNHERRMRGPYPVHEVASLLLAAGMDPDGTRSAMVSMHFPSMPIEINAHDPVFDAKVSALCADIALRSVRVRRNGW